MRSKPPAWITIFTVCNWNVSIYRIQVIFASVNFPTEALKDFSHLKLASSHSYAGKRKVTCRPGFISLNNYIPVCSFLLVYKYTVMILCTLHGCLKNISIIRYMNIIKSFTVVHEICLCSEAFNIWNNCQFLLQ